MLSTILELLGIVMLVTAVGLTFGLAGALFASGAGCLLVAWAINRGERSS